METRVQCCIAGGGPAGLMLGVLLARAGVSVLVVEKHADFLRDFRGDTIHPSTLQVMDELGWLGEFLELPHERVKRLGVQFGSQALTLADFSGLPVAAKFIAMMPQWDFLNFLAEKGSAYPGFRLMTNSVATGLLKEGHRITGLDVKTRQGRLAVLADLVVAADGRGSDVRKAAGLVPQDFGAPMDVLWFRLPRLPSDTAETQGRFDVGRVFVMLNRGDYWQCAFVIPKGANEAVRAAGLGAFRKSVGRLLPFDPARADSIATLDDVKLLTVQVNRLKTWCLPGFIAIGDAAHAMSPVGGVGVNLAVQDAVAAANLLAGPLRSGALTLEHLKGVEKRRLWPVKVTQQLQLIMQNSVIAPTLRSTGELRPPLALRAIAALPLLQGLPARLIGLGVRPEHVAPHIQMGEG